MKNIQMRLMHKSTYARSGDGFKSKLTRMASVHAKMVVGGRVMRSRRTRYSIYSQLCESNSSVYRIHFSRPKVCITVIQLS